MSTTTAIEAPLSFTEGAKAEVKKLIEQQEIAPDFGLRVGVEGGGCAGMNYVLGFDQVKEGDQEFNIDGICVTPDVANAFKAEISRALSYSKAFLNSADAAWLREAIDEKQHREYEIIKEQGEVK
jgi:Fe-S cluster assembly iron-binding protein IscA